MRRTSWISIIGLMSLAGLLGLSACNEDPESESAVDGCEQGRWIQTESAGRVCAVEQEIVIETGFNCPQRVSTRQSVGKYVVCSDGELGKPGRREVRDELDEPPEDVDTGTMVDGPDIGPMDPDTGPDPGGSTKLDLLWVLDNSQSMCQEQRELRENFPKFIESVAHTSIDTNIAVTTTHFANNSSFEKVADPGHIQSTPSPVTGFDPTCRFKVDEAGQPIDHDYDRDGTQGPDYTPVKNQIAQAVECTQDPDKWEDLTNVDRATIECALFGNDPQVDGNACDKAGKNPSDFRTDDLFPPRDAYRDIPLVLRASDYRRADGTVNKDEMRRDFACMSFVGTRGASSEQGLRAAVRAVSPEMTGGTVKTDFSNESERRQHIQNERQDHPNYGLLRDDAKFGLVFVTDENDCSHEGNVIQERSRENSCDEANCYFPQSDNGPDYLLSTTELYHNFMENLAESKGVDSVDQDDLFVASIHGKYRRYSGPVPNQCEKDEQYVKPVCASQLGRADSGDRYEDFIRNFDNFFPEPPENNPDAPLVGHMCMGTLQPALEGIGHFLSPF